jgi:hypothetical protein
VLALSDREELIRRIIELDAEPAAAATSTSSDGPSLLESPRYRAARQGLAPATVASAYVNPRAWDAALAAGPAEDAAHQAFVGF